jgi:hypothetical protein
LFFLFFSLKDERNVISTAFLLYPPAYLLRKSIRWREESVYLVAKRVMICSFHIADSGCDMTRGAKPKLKRESFFIDRPQSGGAVFMHLER